MKTKFIYLFMAIAMQFALLAACNSNAGNGKEQPITRPVEQSTVQPMEKEFYSAGLKYEARVKLSIEKDGKLTGSVTSNEYRMEGETVSFTGTFSDGKIHVTFNGTPPVVGAASEWTGKPWRIETRDGKDVLIIPFNAKNYDTQEWRETDYEFKAVDGQAMKNANTGEVIALPPLKENETLCHEDEWRRISGGWIEGVDAFVISVKAKREGVKDFTVENATAFECVVGDALVLSNGTSNVRMLSVYDLNTGSELFPIEENFIGKIAPDDNQAGFTFYRYAENMPIVYWDAVSGKWREENTVPAELFNSDFERTIQQQGGKLFDGMRLAALQKSRVDIRSKKINYLNEYKWSYIE